MKLINEVYFRKYFRRTRCTKQLSSFSVRYSYLHGNKVIGEQQAYQSDSE